MGLHLAKRDWYVTGALFAVAILSGFLLGPLQQGALVSVHDVTFYLPGPVLLLGSIFIYLSRERLGGTVGRNLEVVGTGAVLFSLTWVVYAQFFTAGFPAWGMTPSFWNTALGLMIVSTLFVMSYGFYLFWKLGQGETGGAK